MADNSSIEWTDATWNPTRGCTRVSEGCRNCYAEIMAARFSKPGQWGHGFAQMQGGDHRWTGKVELIESQLMLPLRWKQPRKIFVNSTSDLFHESLSNDAIDRVFAAMALCPQHIFQVLTKRPERMRHWSSRKAPGGPVTLRTASTFAAPNGGAWPLPNVWLGTSVEDQPTADERLPHLLATPAAVRFLSCEPLLGPIDLTNLPGIGCAEFRYDALRGFNWTSVDGDIHSGFPRGKIDWVITGGESGPNARPMHPDWARSLRDQCAGASVPFFFKQWGEWIHGADISLDERLRREEATVLPDGKVREWQDGYPHARLTDPRMAPMRRVGKKAAGRLLDGIEHNGFPTAFQ